MKVSFPSVISHDGDELTIGVVEVKPAFHNVSLIIGMEKDGEYLEAGWLLDPFAAEQLGKRLIASAQLIQAGAI